MIQQGLSLSIVKNKRKFIVLSLYLIATLFLCCMAYEHYDSLHASLAVKCARTAAAGIYINCALILLPMLRFLLSKQWVRKLAGILPLHYTIEAHIIIASALVIFSAAHVLAYVVLYSSNSQTWAANLASRPANGTGIGLTVLLLIVALGAYGRQSKKFEYFYLSHYLFAPFLLICFWHAPKFAYWASLPILLYLVDRFVRFFWMTKPATVISIAHTSIDTTISMTRPAYFSYQAGDYAFLCIPDISRLEWHPFSLINAPASQGDLSFKIRRYGSWTQGLLTLKTGSTIYIDGPFSSPSRELLACAHSIIIASGIGITPFISFFTDLLNRTAIRHQKIVLYWLERNARDYADFYPLLSKLQERLPDIVTLHLIAGKDSEGDSLNQAFVSKRRIDWNDEFSLLAKQNDGKIPTTVFFCGNHTMSAMLSKASQSYGFTFRTESF